MGFVALAALMLLAALAFVLPPLLRRSGATPARRLGARRRALDDALAAGVITADEFAVKSSALEAETPVAQDAAVARSNGAFVSILLVLLLLPAGAIGLYLKLGNAAALDATAMTATAGTAATGAGMDQAIEGLVAKLAKNPDDVEGWMLLGRAYKSMERFAEARDALKHAFDRAADNIDVQVDYAEALALASDSRRIDGRARELLDKAVAGDANHQRALWLLGIAEYQQQRYAQAVAFWERLRAQMGNDPDATRSIDQQIADARSRAGMPAAASASDATAATAPSPAPAAPTTDATAAADGIRLDVEVALDPALREKAPANASVFVFARAANGPPMPLAVQRLKVSDLPAHITLTEDMGMLPNMKLSQFAQVVVGARISASGNAKAQSGDLQTLSAPIDVKTRTPIRLSIDQVVP